MLKLGDMVVHKQTTRNFGVGLIVEQTKGYGPTFAVHWIEHGFTSKYIHADDLKKVA